MVFARVGPIVALSALLGGCQPVVQQSPGITAAEPCKLSAEAEFLNSFTTYHLNYPQALRGCPLTWKDNNLPAVGVNVEVVSLFRTEIWPLLCSLASG